MEKDLKWIKKHYGEKMMHFCRAKFPSLLEKEGALPSILERRFSANRQLVNDIVEEGCQDEFCRYIYSFTDEIKNEIEINKNKTAKELLLEAGYVLSPECKKEWHIQKFKKFYATGEELCTFRGKRLNTCRVWFAVKENVREIKRENFKHPSRQDEYGTSVISIQFTKGANSELSIKNRYNHTVKNPDNTFNNDLDNIIVGLSKAFERDFGIKTNTESSKDFDMPGYVRAKGKYFKYNHQINGTYYCANNTLVYDYYYTPGYDGPMRRPMYNKLEEHQMLIDYFIFDFQTNEVKLFDKSIKDSFVDSLKGIKKLENKKGEIRVIFEDEEKNDVIIKYDEQRNIIGVIDDNIKTCGDKYMCHNKKLKELQLPNLIECGDNFFATNESLRQLNLSKLKKCGNYFLGYNSEFAEINLPNLEECGNMFMYSFENGLDAISFPSLVQCGNYFMGYNENIKKAYFSKLKKCGEDFLANNTKAKVMEIPFLEEYSYGFVDSNPRRDKFLRKTNAVEIEC